MNKSFLILIGRLTLLLLLIYGLYISLDIPQKRDKAFFNSLLILVGLGFVIFLIIKWAKDNKIHLISIYFLFVISFLIVHFQLPLLDSLGYSATGYFEYFIWNNDYAGNKATAISSLGILSFFVGNTFWMSKMNFNFIKSAKILKREKHSSLLIYSAYLAYFLFFFTSGSYKYGKYAVGDQLLISNYFNYLFSILLPAAIINRLYYMSSLNLVSIKILDYVKTVGFPISFLVLWHIVFSIFVGDRGPIITFGLLYFSLYFLRVRQLGLIVLIPSFILLGSLMVILGAARTKTGEVGFRDRVEQAISSENTFASRLNIDRNSNLMTSTIELALSGRCLNHAVANVPDNYDYKYGYYQVKQIGSAMPFFSSILLKYYANNEWQYDGSSNFITYLIQGDKPTYGDGTTPTADLYLDFGVYGVILGLFFFGWIFQFFDYNLLYSKSPNLLVWVFALTYFAGAIYLGRTSFLIFFQKVIPLYFVICINQLIVYKSIIR